MQNYGFFNSSSGDRRYAAEDWAAYFASFIGNGVFPNPSTGLQVMEDEGMRVAVQPNVIKLRVFSPKVQKESGNKTYPALFHKIFQRNT